MKLNKHARDEAGADGAAPDEDGLAGADLAGWDLSGRDLSGENLAGADLSGAMLRGADLSGADLHDASLVDAQAAEAIFAGADLHGADLGAADLTSADFAGASLRQARLELAILTSANLTSADLRQAQLQRADLTSTNLTNADLRSASLSHGHLHARLTGAIVSGARFNGAFMPDGQRDEMLRSGTMRPSQLVAVDMSLGDGLAAAVPWTSAWLVIRWLLAGRRYLRYWRTARSGARQRRGGLESHNYGLDRSGR